MVAELLAMVAERVTRSDASKLAEIPRREQKRRDADGLLRQIDKSLYPDHAAVFTQRSQDRGGNLDREWTRVEDELILAVYWTLSWPSWPTEFLGYRIVAGLVGAALEPEIKWDHVRYVIDRHLAENPHPNDPARSSR
ncbi:MAG TPA: hypothetical protein VGJ20_42790 [Xanthobacteraceae bacterium]|jgi:hypothetical protein